MKKVLSICFLSILTLNISAQEYLRYFKRTSSGAPVRTASESSNSEEEFNFSALPGIIAPLTSATITPSIKINAGRSISTKNKFLAFDLFIAKEPGVSNDDLSSSNLRSTISRNIWLPESSSFFFRVAGGRYNPFRQNSYKSQAPLKGAIGYSFYYMNKQVPSKSDGNIMEFDQVSTVGIGQFQLNFRKFISTHKVKNVALFYLDYNLQFGIDRVTQYTDYLGLPDNDISDFVKFGVEVELTSNEKSDTKFYFDLGFIIQRGRVKEIIKNNDIAIPIIKLSLEPNFK